MVSKLSIQPRDMINRSSGYGLAGRLHVNATDVAQSIIRLLPNRQLLPFFRKNLVRASELTICLGSLPLWQRSAWRTACQRAGVPCHDVAESGAYNFVVR